MLDVHENHGGNNPFVFLSWFAGKPWDHQNVHVRVWSDFTEDETRQFLYGDTLVERYKAAASEPASKRPGPFSASKTERPSPVSRVKRKDLARPSA